MFIAVSQSVVWGLANPFRGSCSSVKQKTNSLSEDDEAEECDKEGVPARAGCRYKQNRTTCRNIGKVDILYVVFSNALPSYLRNTGFGIISWRVKKFVNLKEYPTLYAQFETKSACILARVIDGKK